MDELNQIESDINPKLPERNEDNWTRFFKWIETELSNKDDDKKLSDKIYVAKQSSYLCNLKNEPEQQNGGSKTTSNTDEDEANEYSLIAKVPFKKGDHIFSITRQVMMTTETAIKDSDLFDFVMNDSIASGMQNVVLVLHLLNEYSKQEQSYWWPYLSILPNKLLPILSVANNKNRLAISSLLASAYLFEALKLLRAIARQYSYFYKRLQSTRLPLRKAFTFKYYAWGVSIVCSRQNEIPTSDRQACMSPIVHALIPILDMCNHNKDSNQASFENNQSCLVASTDLEANAEITINYGSRSSGEFYIHNGFVPANSSTSRTPFDFVPFTFALNQSNDPLYEKRSKLLKALNMPAFGRFKLILNTREYQNKRDPYLTMFLVVYLMTEQDLDFVASSDNPVGIADEIYDYVQYHEQRNMNESAGEPDKVTLMKKRLARDIKSYLSKRANICVSLIERTLKQQASTLDKSIGLLLEREKSIYESYIVNMDN